MDLNFNEMKTVVHFLLTIVIAVFASSCIPTPLPIDDIAKLQPKVVVSSQMLPGGVLVILITKSVSALEAGWGSNPEDVLSKAAISDAEVTISVGDAIVALPNLGDGLYGNINLDLQPNRDYMLKVKTPELGEVYSITQMKPFVPFRSVQATLFKSQFDSVANVSYSLQDLPGLNWYMVNVQKFSQTQQITSLLNPRVFTHLRSDSAVEGKILEEEFKVLFRRFKVGDTVAVTMASISQEYYQFLKTRFDRRYSAGAFATEPLNFKSNVNGGLGYFNLFLPDARLFVLE
jgi:membrane-bound metal-dependent hydrolase YbcI (DUF457 family)